MLTSDLLRYKIDENQVRPNYLTRRKAQHYLPIAEDLINIFERHVGRLRYELEDALGAYESDRVDYKILRGLTKMLDAYAVYEPVDEIEYPRLRRELFEYVQAYRPIVRESDLIHKNTRVAVLTQFEKDRMKLPQDLYGDLPENHKLARFAHQLSPEDLLRRYNLALAQGLLYRCTEVRIQIQDTYKEVFRYLKLAQLMHQVFPANPGYRIIINGPFSLFGMTQRYGVNLARFLPGLLLAKNWRMEAFVNTGAGMRMFYLDNNSGLTTYYGKENPFDSVVEQAFFSNFSKRLPDWQIEREPEIIDLGESVLIPDFKLCRPDGREFLLEIVGFWTPEYLQKKFDKLRRANLKNIVIAVCEKLNCDREQFAGKVIFYKTRLMVRDVLNAVESMINDQ